MLVSVIIPTYFRNSSLKRAIQSVEKQTHTPIELIVVDDSGNRNAESVVGSNSSATYLPHEKNVGAQAARDTGLRHADGDYIQFLDDDDRLLPKKIEAQVELMEFKDTVDVSYCGLRRPNGVEYYPNPAVRGNVLFDALGFHGYPLTTSTMLVGANTLEDVKPLTRESRGADDIRLAIELAKRTKFDYVDEILVRRGEPGRSRGFSWGAVEGRWNVLEEYAPLYNQAPDYVLQNALAETYQIQGRRYLADRYWSASAIFSFAQVLRYTPTITPLQIGEFVVALSGRPGHELAKKVWQTFQSH